MDHKFYILIFDAIFTWKHFFNSPLKWIIKIFTKSNFNHVAYCYTSHNQRQQIKESNFYNGFVSISYKKKVKNLHSKIWAYQVKKKIDFKKTHEVTKKHFGDGYKVEDSIKSILDRFNFRKGSKKFSFCSKAVLLILKTNGYLLDIKQNDSLTPKELKILIEKRGLCLEPILVWDKDHFVNNIFIKNEK